MSEKLHPCVSCGACCAFFRVSFFVHERENFDKWKVPLDRTVTTDSKIYSMQGTEKKHHPKCNSLTGRIGKYAICNMYENRPSPCRNFTASYSDGKKNSRCDEARKAHGLAPLSRSDWHIEPLKPAVVEGP
jgi:Fe-S-cluster containining protein